MDSNLISLIYVIIGVASFSLISARLKLPLIIGYILVGVILGGSGVNLINQTSGLKLTADIGLTLLLFIVGLKLDISAIKNMGNSFLLGIIKILGIFLIGFLLSKALGYNLVTSSYIAIALSFSSTIVIVKMLSDKGELDSLSGRLSLGSLIVEDIVAIICMIFINTTSGISGSTLGVELLKLSKSAFIIGATILLLTKFIIPRYVHSWVKSSEILMIISISFAIIISALCQYLGFSMEVGAFIAGMCFAPYKEYRYTISSKLSSLRDFTLIFFFVKFGISLQLNDIIRYIPKILIYLSFVVLFKPIMAIIILRLLKYKPRTQVITGLYLSQISEFSIILLELGNTHKAINHDTISLMGIVLILSIIVSSLYINYAQKIYEFLSVNLKLNGLRLTTSNNFEDENALPTRTYTDIIIGVGEFGAPLSDYFQLNDKKVLEIDFDPVVVSKRKEQGRNIIYGDVEDFEFLSHISLKDINWVINTTPTTDNKKVLNALRQNGFTGPYATKLTEFNKENIEKTEGIELIFEPYINAAKEAFVMISEQDIKIKKEKIRKSIEELNNHYIICGFGRMGKQIAKDFQNEMIPYVVVEENPEHFNELLANNYLHIIGNASSDETLIAAGINRAKGLIAVYPTDELNVFIVLTARNLNPDLDIVARSIIEANEDKLRRAGANKVISPYMFGARKIAAAVLRPTVFEFNELTYHGNEFDIVFEEVILSETCRLKNKTIAESQFRQEYGVTIVAIKRKTGEIIPNPNQDLPFLDGDTIIVIAGCKELEKLRNSKDFIIISNLNHCGCDDCKQIRKDLSNE